MKKKLVKTGMYSYQKHLYDLFSPYLIEKRKKLLRSFMRCSLNQ